MIALHEEIPTLRLPDSSGHRVSTRDYKQERPLVLVFAGRDGARLAAEFSQRYPHYREANAEVIEVVSEDTGERAPFPVLLDPGGEVSARYIDRTPGILVTDAYGVLEGRFDAERPDHTRILNLVAALEMRCPECGVPEWSLD